MFIVRIQGGIGNQMFQYAFGYSIAERKNKLLKLDPHDLKNSNFRKFGLDLYSLVAEIATAREISKLKKS